MNVLLVFSDQYLFWGIEAALFLFWLVAWFLGRRPERDGVSIKRGPVALSHFNSAYAAITAVLVALPLAVESAKDYRVICVFLNILAVAHLCFFNRWFRNWMLGQIAVVEKVEQ